jgi:starch phosphorylase
LTTHMATQLPDRINRLEELAHDLWWSWNTDARRVFRTLDYPLWRQTAHNPVRMLQIVPPDTLANAMKDAEWLANYDRSIARLDDARSAKQTWCET